MFPSVKMAVAGTSPRGPARRSLLLGISLLGLTLLTGCPQTPPQMSAPPQAADNELHFDKRYYDSIEMTPRSARTERELAIFTQLQRLDHIKRDLQNAEGKIDPLSQQPNPPFEERVGDGPIMHFAGKEEALADIYHKIDSLKVLEHVPLTPHPVIPR
jgi:hypothetical protein